MQLWWRIVPFIDYVLRPFGLIMWMTLAYDDGESGPVNFRVTRIGIGRRPSLDRAVWEAKHKGRGV